ncbi:unnamed protein product [Acanthoscelides obtectus]|uniref:Rasputin n=1 Tax=Acanthoscelides obtectus TaxID=200917 RepID=A0A9P0KF13_ACAOB|nr:unnamed protein product [Acanthoscelides obtectus]CAK1680239.1 Ras GTPase-activating protein-binding protein 2 [Acanthoscelides obtectus]
MVMEAPPSPQSVGREFVRQYYTLLNKAPTHLHRFYNHQSSFIHGGLDLHNRETSPVIGQKQIHQKIQQLNFRDCHAKITQVDSQATLGNGVVVQVTGELSNAGQPMRRFTQTFVLAAQSPKKYYVHNDIFRYQDEIISDEECDADQRSDVDEDIGQDRQVINDVQQSLSTQPTAAAGAGGIPPYYPAAGGGAPMPPTMPQVPMHHNQQPPVPNAAQQHVLSSPPQQVATVNGAIHPDDISVIPGQVPNHVPPTAQSQTMGGAVPSAMQQPPQQQQPANAMLQQQAVAAPINDHQQLQQPTEEAAEEKQIDDWDTLVQPQQQSQQQQQQPQDNGHHEPEQPQESAPNEPKTYANLLKSGNTGSTMNFNNAAQNSVAAAQPQPYGNARAVSPVAMGGAGRPMGGPRADGPPGQTGGQQRPPRQDSIRGSQGGMRGSVGNDDGFDDRRRSQGGFNDVNQLFLGNLPHTATEDELREIFSEFGEIMDLRIHSKPLSKIGGQPGGRAPPNYGFITYKLQQHVQACLISKPIFYPRGDKNGTQLNVEEKKPKDRPPYSGGASGGGSRQSMDGGPRGGRGDRSGMPPRDDRRMGGGAPGGPNRNAGGPPPNRSNSYQNRNASGGPPGQRGGPNSYRR